ncbi:hypothetical protein [Cesiribacter sp. SM1]|uniref:hypothetical protein n=1 Tax=Cesiribacter sp. SM1 TaxID=2861196 RepID=UPI001CD3DCB7|nr:hypothetical protein [Cesiribacter sp. SM1]
MESTKPIKQFSLQAANNLTTEAPSEQKPGSSSLTNGKAAAARHYGSLQKQPAAEELPWIQLAPGAPYFITEKGNAWTPIGQNDAITWPDFANAFRRKNLQQVDAHLAWLAENGVTCLRFMLEYAQVEHRYFESPAGTFSPNMVKLWDDLFALCAKHRLRILLTPFDTFWMWIRWKHHPYNKAKGGPCNSRSEWLLCPHTLEAIKKRLSFATGRWGGSGVLFAWDLWNEIHPAHANNRTDVFDGFIREISQHLRETEQRLYGRSHLQTVSLYGPVLYDYPDVADVIFRHPSLDFATNHFYDTNTINNPKDTVGPAISTGKLVREALQHIPGSRPFFDSEHGPIHAFKDRKITLPESFDDEYFRHMQWAHFASGGAGGGMRWPNRHPHVLTHGMRRAQKALADFVPLIDWSHFSRKNLNEEVKTSNPDFASFACGDSQQAIVWLLRRHPLAADGTLNAVAHPAAMRVTVPGLLAGKYQITFWSTLNGIPTHTFSAHHSKDGNFSVEPVHVATDLAMAISKLD